MLQLLGISALLLGSSEGCFESGNVCDPIGSRGLPIRWRVGRTANLGVPIDVVVVQLLQIDCGLGLVSSAPRVPTLLVWRATPEVRAADEPQ